MSSPLASLVYAYDRMADRGEVPPFGYSIEKIGFVISLNEDGTPAGIPIDLRGGEGKKRVARPIAVPQAIKRSVNIAPNFLWDKTSYVLGITAGEDRRLSEVHTAFVQRHEEVLADVDDVGLKALLAFLTIWTPEQFETLGWPADMKDQNVIFALEKERLNSTYIHDRPVARTLWARISSEGAKTKAVCLVTGETAPVAQLHPAIKGVWGAQSSGASIVSFNLNAFTSYGHEQGDNAPVSETASSAYTTVLNNYLSSDSRNRVQIGDTSTVFWADTPDAEAAKTAENTFLSFLDESDDGEIQTQKVKAILEKLRNGQRLEDFDPHLANDVRFCVLGLAPNAARLSVRFWYENTFGQLAANYQRFVEDMRIEPPPHNHPNPPIWRYLVETAVLGKRDNVPPNLAGDWMRAILTGTRYPLTLLSTVLMRIRADGEVNAYRAAMLKAVLNRNFNWEAPVALDIENTNKGYVLGRLFAVYEQIQTAALGRNVNATIKDKFYSSASAQPRKVFKLLDTSSSHHLSKLGKQSPGYRVVLEKQLSDLMAKMSPSDDPFPTSFSAEQQTLFALGYYHQRSEFFKSKKTDISEGADI